MKKEKSHSLYRNLIVRIVFFLVIPFLTVIIFFGIGIKRDFDRSYRTNIQLYVGSAPQPRQDKQQKHKAKQSESGPQG